MDLEVRLCLAGVSFLASGFGFCGKRNSSVFSVYLVGNSFVVL